VKAKASEKADNGAMARGRRLEAVALAEYSSLMGYAMEPVCCVHDEYEWLKASLDGWNAERRLVAEIKAPNRDDHEQALAGRVPLHYETQVRHQLLVTGAPLLHYVSYSDYFPPHRRLAVVPVLPVKDELDMLLEALKEFWWHVENRVQPGVVEIPPKGSLEGHGYTSPKKPARSRKKTTSGVKD
jgi:putative phage-type endonuclease